MIFTVSPGFSGGEVYLHRWKKFSESYGTSLVAWLEGEAKAILTGGGKKSVFSVKTPPYYGRLGLFVTIMKGKRVRGCFGGFHHLDNNFSGTIRRYLKGALRSDPRYPPLGIEELEDSEVIITVASQPSGIENIEVIDLEQYGILYFYQDGSSAVIVPAEVRTVDYLKKTAEKKEVLSRASFRAVTIRNKKK